MANDGGEGALVVVPVGAAAMETENQHVVGDSTVTLPTKLLKCHVCHRPLAPPIYKCDDEHLVCASCRGVHDESCVYSATHSKLADTFASSATVPCGNESFSCVAGRLVYYEAADHRGACPHAPCTCPEQGCRFIDTRPKLLDHVSDTREGHSRPIFIIRYGQPRKLTLPLSERWYILVGEEDQNVFLVSVGEHGQGRGATTAVSLVCVRSTPGAVQFSCRLAVEHPGDGARVISETPLMSSSSLSGGAPTPDEVSVLPVPNAYLAGNSVPLMIDISKLSPSPPPAPVADTLPPPAPVTTILRPAPVAATLPPPAPVTTIFPPPAPAAAVKPAGTDQRNNKRKASNPSKLFP